MIQATVIGNIVKEPTVFNYGQDGRQGVRLMIASNNARSYTEDEPKATFISVTLFRWNSYMKDNFYVGRPVTLIGEIRQEERDENNALYPMNMIANEFALGPGRATQMQEPTDEDYNGGPF